MSTRIPLKTIRVKDAAPTSALPTRVEPALLQPKSQQDLLASDCRLLCAPDITSPFINLEDAVIRLLPFHMWASEEGDEADLAETADGTGANLMCSRDEAWRDMCLKKVMDFIKRGDIARQHIEAAERKYDPFGPHIPAEEKYLLERLLLEDAKNRLQAEKAKHETPS